MRVNISMTKEFHEKVKQAAKEHGLSISEYIRFVLLKEWGKC